MEDHRNWQRRYSREGSRSYDVPHASISFKDDRGNRSGRHLMITVKINESSVDLIRYGETLHTWIAPRQSENIMAACNRAEEDFPFDEVEIDE